MKTAAPRKKNPTEAYARYRETAAAYVTSLERTNTAFPLRVHRGKWNLDLSIVMDATKLPLTAFHNKSSVREILDSAFRAWMERTKMSNPSPEDKAAAEIARRKAWVSNKEKFETYAADLRAHGAKIPSSQNDRRMPDYKRISAATGISQEWFRTPASTSRGRLQRRIFEEIGLEAPSYDGTEPVTRMYGEFAAYVRTSRQTELRLLAAAEGELKRPNDAQQLSNTVLALNEFRRCHGKEDEDVVGDELLEQYEAALAKSLNMQKPGSQPKHRSEMNRVRGYLVKMRSVDGLPEDGVDALNHLMFVNRVNLEILCEALELSKEQRLRLAIWLRKQQIPAVYQAPIFNRIEEFFALPQGTLASRVRFRNVRQRYYDRSLFPPEFKQPHVSLIRDGLPENFAELDEAERHKLAREILLLSRKTEIAFRNDIRAHTINRFRLIPGEIFISQDCHACGEGTPFPRLSEEIQHYIRFKTAEHVPFSDETDEEMVRDQRWKLSSSDIFHTLMARFFGAAALPLDAGGIALAPEDATMVLMSCPRVFRWFVEWAGKRYKAPRKIEGEVLRATRSLLNATSGWLKQRPDLGRRMSPLPDPRNPGEFLVSQALIDEMRSDWAGWCARRHESLRHRVTEIRNLPNERVRDPFESIMQILLHPRPLDLLAQVGHELRAEMPNKDLAPLEWALAVQSMLMWEVLLETKLRCRNVTEISLSLEAPNRLIREGDHYVHRLKVSDIKNATSPFYKRNSRTSEPFWNYDPLLTPWIDAFLSEGRAIILDGRTSDSFFIRRFNVRSKAPGVEENNVYDTIVRLSGRLAYNELTGTGIRGVEKFGPQAFRDIAATHMLKTGKTMEQAAAVLMDTVETTRKYYARFEVSDELEQIQDVTRLARAGTAANAPHIRAA